MLDIVFSNLSNHCTAMGIEPERPLPRSHTRYNTAMKQRAISPDYGIDAPYVLTAITVAGLICLVLAIAVHSLPYTDKSFDAILSLNMLHNIDRREERAVALRELARVLKPGGSMILCDFRNVAEYTSELRSQGITDVHKEFTGWVGFFPMFAAVVQKESSLTDSPVNPVSNTELLRR